MKTVLRFLLVLAFMPLAVGAFAAEYVSFQGAACNEPPVLRCPDENCSTPVIINQGLVVEMKSRRTFFLDYPCDLKPGEKVTFVLNLHGGGSYGNWQRHYFPIADYVTQYRLVVATPNSPIRVWTEVDDQYLQNIVESVIDQLGKDNIRSFWLAGHSQGGMTSNRLLRTAFFKARADGWLSLSGGRLGGNPGRAERFGEAVTPAADDEAAKARMVQFAKMFAVAEALLGQLPENDISFIYTTGEREVDGNGVPAESILATAEGCSARVKSGDVADSKPGYVYDASRQDPPNPAWGLLPAPGTAETFVYPNCRNGRVIADVVRLNKGHTEGLEPNVTEALVKLIVSAPGGRISGL